MSNKPYPKLDPVDRAIRMAYPTGMFDGIHVTIEYFSGFELFNTRAYHNYETWSNGYRVFDDEGNKAEAEDLDVAVSRWAAARKAAKEAPNA